MATHQTATPAAVPSTPPRDIGRGGAHAWSVDVAAALLGALHLVVVGLVVAGGGPYRDDFRLQSKALEEPLLTWLFLSPESHFAPIPRLIIYGQARLAPWDQGTATATTVLLLAIQFAMLWLLVRELCGPRSMLLPIVAVFALSPALVPPAGWWTQAVTLTPANVGFLATLWLVARYHRTGATRDLVAALTAYAVGLLSWEKSLLALPAAVALSVLVLHAGTSLRSSVAAAARHRALWLGMAALTILHLVWYSLGPFDTGGDATDLTLALAVRYAWVNLTHALVPGLVGGPWQWNNEVSDVFGIAGPSVALRGVAAALVLVAIGLAWSRSPRRTFVAGGLIMSVWVPGIVMLLVGRVTKFGLWPALDYRYLPEVVMTALVAYALAVVPHRGDMDPQPWSRAQRSVAGFLLVTVLAGSVVSISRWGAAWHRNPATAYAANLRADVISDSTPRRVYDTTMPTDVLSPLFRPYHRHSIALLPLNQDGRLDFDAATPPAWVVMPDGTLAPGQLQVLATGRPGPFASCGWSINPGRPSVVIGLDQRVPALPNTFLRLGMLNGIDATFIVEILDDGEWRPANDDGRLDVAAGLESALVRVDDASVAAVRVTTLQTTSGSCIDKLVLGVPVAAP